MIVGWFGYGGGSWQALALRDKLADNGIELITCHEYPNATVKYDQDTINSFVQRCDVIILPQRTTLENAKGTNRLAIAWYNKRAAVVSPLPSYMKYVKDGVNALVANSPDEFIEKCIQLKNDANLRATLAQNGHHTAINSLNPKTLVDKLVSKYRKHNDKQYWQIVIPHYLDRSDYLNLAIKSSLDSEGPDRDIVVVSSSAHPPVIADEHMSTGKVRLVHSNTRLSFSHAINRGMELGKAEATHFLLLNDDVIVGKTAFRKMSESIAGKDIILNPYSNCDKGWLHNEQLVAGGLELVPGMDLEQIDGKYNDIVNYSPAVSGVGESPFCAFYATLIPRSVTDKVGRLSTSYANGGEDADYCYRANRLGYGCYWAKDAFIFHFGGKSRKHSESQNYANHHEEDKANNLLLHRKWNRGNKKRVAIWTGPAWEQWSIDAYRKQGIGGSETCAARLALEFTNDGHHVTMIGAHPRETQEDIHMLPWEQFNPDEEYFDLFIASRNINPIDKRIRAKRIYVWVHDIWLMSGQAISPEKYDMIDGFLCLSPWHKSFFTEHHKIPTEHQGKMSVVPNGINVELFDQFDASKKVLGKAIWSSSPDRGLDNLLYLSDFIKDGCPDFHIDVYYGFYNWETSAKSRNDANALKQIEEFKREIEKRSEFVHLHGRVSQAHLAKEWEKAHFWLYPTRFWETYCITAKEASLTGTPIVCSDLAALNSTVGDAGYLVKHGAYTKEGRQEFLDQAHKLYHDRDYWAEMSQRSLGGSVGISWPDVYYKYWKPLLP